MKVQKCEALPKNLNLNTIYRLDPRNPDEKYYWERVDRNIGWITREEQMALRKTVIGVAGCGGMGGQLAEKFLRLGVGEVRIADCEVFDISNINRQFAATRSTIGKSKAFETARMLREISDDFTLEVYPQGITEATADQFISGCDIVCDEIEFWAVGARILLHQQARKFKKPVFNCNTVGFGTRLFLFTHDSQTMEDCLGLSYQEAKDLQEKIQSRKATREEINKVMNSVLNGLVPSIPEYCEEKSDYKNVRRLKERLFEEGKASIIATNPSMATGFLADWILINLLSQSKVIRDIIETPKMPGYLYFDAAKMRAEIVRK